MSNVMAGSASNVNVGEDNSEIQARDNSSETSTDGANDRSGRRTAPAKIVAVSNSGENELAPQAEQTPVYPTPCDTAPNFFLVRVSHPKMDVPLLVVSGDPEKPGMEVKAAITDQIGPNTSRIHIDGSAIQAIPSTSANLIALQHCPSPQHLTIKGGGKVVNKATEDDPPTNRVFLTRSADSAELFFLHQTPVNIDSDAKHAGANMKTVAKFRNGAKQKKQPVEKQFICELDGCGRSFSSKSYLRYHQAVHQGQKSLKCQHEGCDRKFSWPAHLKYHELTHNGDRRFKCTVADCGKTFYTPQSLSVHVRTHTGEKPFVCEEVGCGKSFTTAGNLKNHSRVHTGERPFLCTYQNCGRQFAEYSSLKKHKLTHTGEKPYSCNICGRTFSQSGSQKVHMRGHLKVRPSKKHKRQKNVEPSKQNGVVLLRQDDILQYQDYQSAESVVFSQAVGDHVVTVTTQPAEGESDQLSLHPEILGVEEVLTSEECIPSDALCGSSTMGANVVVLSQPQEIVSMATDFTSGDRPTQEEVVYGSDVLHSDLDHEEIARNISEPGLSEDQAISHHSPTRGTEQEVGMDPMMETDSESEEEVWVEND